MRRFLVPTGLRLIYWRCVWANKWTATAYVSLLVAIVLLSWLIIYDVRLDEPVFHRFMFPGVFCLYYGVIAGLLTGMGYSTHRKYCALERHMLSTGHTDCEWVDECGRAYCWRVAARLALRDYRKGHMR